MSKYAIYAIACLALFAAGGLLGWHERVLREPAMLTAQQNADNKQCNVDKQITKEANDEIVKNCNATAERLNALELQHPASCVPVTSQAQLPSAGQPKHAGQNGISSQWLRTFAAECETYRAEVSTCINFIDNTWKAAGQ